MKKKAPAKKKVASKKQSKLKGKPSGRKLVNLPLPGNDPHGEIHGHNYYVREDKRSLAGRPLTYNKAVLELAVKYCLKLPTDEVVHTIEGLSDYLMVARKTIYEWEKDEDKREFCYIVEWIRAKQAKTLINKGLNRTFEQSITKMMMGKHGYADMTHNTNDNMNSEVSPEERKRIKELLDEAI